MAIDNKKYEALHNKTGSDLAKIKKHFDDGDHNNLLDFPAESAIVYQMQKMQEELDYLRGLISNNKDKTTFPGIGTSGSTCLAGDTTTISASQASAITANTAKVSFPVTAALNNALSFEVNGKSLIIKNTIAQLSIPGQPSLAPQVFSITLKLK